MSKIKAWLATGIRWLVYVAEEFVRDDMEEMLATPARPKGKEKSA
jgi:hypothetical protein